MDPGRSVMQARALPVLNRLVTATVVVVILSLARPVLMPIAFAAFLAFILTPPMKWLQHRISRVPALVVVMLLAVGVIGGAGVGPHLPARRADVPGRHLRRGASAARRPSCRTAAASRWRAPTPCWAGSPGSWNAAATPDLVKVRVVEDRLSPAAHLWSLVSPLAEPLVTVFFVLVLCLFILGQRDDLRNRLIRLMGTGQRLADHPGARRGRAADHPPAAGADADQRHLRRHRRRRPLPPGHPVRRALGRGGRPGPVRPLPRRPGLDADAGGAGLRHLPGLEPGAAHGRALRRPRRARRLRGRAAGDRPPDRRLLDRAPGLGALLGLALGAVRAGAGHAHHRLAGGAGPPRPGPPSSWPCSSGTTR